MQQDLDDYKAYQRAVSEVDTLKPLITAYSYHSYRQQLATLTARVEEAQEEQDRNDTDTVEAQVRANDLLGRRLHKFLVPLSGVRTAAWYSVYDYVSQAT